MFNRRRQAQRKGDDQAAERPYDEVVLTRQRPKGENQPALRADEQDDQSFAAAKVPTIIAKGTTLTGVLKSEGEVQIDGCVEGDVIAPRVSVSIDGEVKGKIFSPQVVFAGRLDGKIDARKVTILKPARIEGSVLYEKLALEPGAEVNAELAKRATAPKSSDPKQSTKKDLQKSEETVKASP